MSNSYLSDILNRKINLIRNREDGEIQEENMARGIGTKCIHLEEDGASLAHYGAISYPIYQTATYAHPAVGESTGFDYSRLQNPTREQVEKVVASLENGIDALALSSGMVRYFPDDGTVYARRSSDCGCGLIRREHPSV